MSPGKPTYVLTRVQEIVFLGNYHITGRAGSDAAGLGFDESDILECVAALLSAHFDKSMESEVCPGLWQDVYKCEYSGIPMYVKLQVAKFNKPDELAVVISFHRCKE